LANLFLDLILLLQGWVRSTYLTLRICLAIYSVCRNSKIVSHELKDFGWISPDDQRANGPVEA
jgi:hypothetical protein